MSGSRSHISRADSSTENRKRKATSQESSQSSRSRDSFSPKRRNTSSDGRAGRSIQTTTYDRRRNFQNGDNSNFRRNRVNDRPMQQRIQGRFPQNRNFNNQRMNNIRYDNRNDRNNFQRRDNQYNQRGFIDRNRINNNNSNNNNNNNNRNWGQNNDNRRFQNQRNQGTWNNRNSQTNFNRRPQDRPPANIGNRFNTGERYWKQNTSIERYPQNRSQPRSSDSVRPKEIRSSREDRQYEERGRRDRSSPELSPEPGLKPAMEEKAELSDSSEIEKPVSEKKKRKKRSRSSSSSSSSSESSSSSSSDSSDSNDSSDESSSSSSSEDEKKKKKKRKLAKKLKKREKKEKKKRKKRKLKKKLGKKLKNVIIEEKRISTKIETEQDRLLNDISLEQSMRAKAMAPISKKEWEKRQNVVRRIYDEASGRHRLIKGDGEVIEEIVSRERHKQINNLATRSDGEYFQSQLRKK